MRNIRVKPSKGQSMMGFIVGIIFCFIGFFVVIPTAGAFGLFWTAIAIAITVSHGINAFGEKGIASYEVNISDEEAKGNNKVEYKADFDERLRKIKSLYEEGIITEEEYNKKREEILREKW